MIRCVATDLDGTLVRSDGTVSERTVKALKQWELGGGLLVLVTGRPPRWVHGVADQLEHEGMAICANGAAVYDLASAQIVQLRTISPDVLMRAIADLRSAIPEGVFAFETSHGFFREAAYIPRFGDGGSAPIELDAAGDEVIKLLMRCGARSSDEVLALTTEILGDTCDATHSTPDGGALIEISAAGVSKASTLEFLCAERGLGPQEVVAFGDMPNDLPMLAWAGSAYAVANAHPEVLASCTSHTASNDDDGVAVIVERLPAPGVGGG